jgi:hypothetical protein
MHVVQTEDVPPKMGRIILANIGSSQNIKTALINRERKNKIKPGDLTHSPRPEIDNRATIYYT